MRMRIPNFYTGWLGPVEFKDGVSVGLVSPRQVNNLKAAMQGVEVLQDDGETIDEALNTIFPILPLGHYLDAGTEPPSPYLTDWNGGYPVKAEPEQAPVTPADVQLGLPKSDVPSYTREQLEKVADEGGIAALRELADPMGIKGTSIAKIIDTMMAVIEKSTATGTLESPAAVVADAPVEGA